MIDTSITKSRNVNWLPREVEKLKRDYRSGKKIKVIAFELGRSATAVTKFLHRAGISRQCPRKGERKVPTTPTIKRKILIMENDKREKICSNVVEFQCVLDYLRKKGHIVYRVQGMIPNFTIDEEVFVLNSKLITKMRLLLLANRIRVEEREQIFEIDD